jgi:hypothetical protein
MEMNEHDDEKRNKKEESWNNGKTNSENERKFKGHSKQGLMLPTFGQEAKNFAAKHFVETADTQPNPNALSSNGKELQ